METLRIDLTDQVTPGEESALTYRASYRANDVPPGGDIALSSYVVWYADPL